MSRLSELLLSVQKERGLTDRSAAEQISSLVGTTVIQQTYSSWKRGTTPRDAMRTALAEWLGISVEKINELADDEPADNGPSIASLANVRQYGRMADRKTGKLKFDAFNRSRRIPDGRYKIRIDTKVMEPALLVGCTAWLDAAMAAHIGNDVVVHADGFGWLGRLDAWDASGATLHRYSSDPIHIKDVDAIHPIILSSRV